MNKLNELGIKEGLWKYYSNDKLYIESNYIDGILNGFYKRHYDNGQLWIEGYYLMGNRIGLWNGYDKLGQLKSKKYYE